MTSDAPHTPVRPWRLPFALLAAVFVSGLLQASGGPLALPIGTAFVPCGFALLAVLARMGDTRPAARPPALVLLAGTVAALALGSLALVVLHVVEPGSLHGASQDVRFTAGGEARLSFTVVLLAGSAAATLLALFRNVREAVDDIIPIDPTTYSHALGLATAVAITLLPLLPLFVLGRPPMPLPTNALPPGAAPVALPSFTERSLELGWFAVATLIAAGPGARRHGKALAARLGLVWPALWQLAASALAGTAFAWLRPHTTAMLAAWTGWPATLPEAWLPEAVPWVSVVPLSLAAALGTELTYRGFLQPRLGLVLSNLVLAAPLAWTSGWVGLSHLFVLGLGLGLARQWAGTYAALAAHVAFLLGTSWQLPGAGPR